MAISMDLNEWVTLNGDRQNLRILSRDAKNPLLLFLHGGPGVCDRHMVLKYQSALAEDFTMVMWDQRGSGKSFTKEILKSELHVEDYLADAKALVEYLCRRFGQEKLILACHSWGTILGTPLAKDCPERVAAYIGQGQFVNGAENERLSYEFCLREARKRGDVKAEKKLLNGPPTNGRYPSHDAMMVQRDCLTRYGGGDYKEHGGIVKSLLLPLLKSPEYSLLDLPKFAKGAMYLTDVLWGEVVDRRFDETVKSLAMPVLLTTGRHDFNTPTEISRKWFDALDAPRKEWVWFEESAHSPIKEEPEKWGQTVREFCLSLG